MKKHIFAFAALCLFASSAWVAVAQEAAPYTPPKVLRIGREEVKPGKDAAHEKMEAAWARAFADAKAGDHWIGMTSLTGNNEVWFVSRYDSLAEIEKNQQDLDKNPALKEINAKYAAQEAEYLSAMHTVVAVYHDDLSYQGVKTNTGLMRYLYVTTVRVRPGHTADFEAATKMSRAAHEKANVPERWSVFEVNEGMPRGTYLILEPLKSLADVDNFVTTHGQTYRDAIGDEGRKKLAELNSAGTISTETNIFAFSPAMSNAPIDVAAADPAFWTPKPAKKAAAAAPAKESDKKTAAKP